MMATVIQNPPDEYLNKKQASQLLGVCTRTLENWVREGKLKASKPTKQTFRIKRSSIDEMMDRHASVISPDQARP